MSRIRLVALGGSSPEFVEGVPITRPTLPSIDGVLRDVETILRSRLITKGRFLSELEAAVGAATSAECVGVASCTTGLLLSLLALGVSGECIVPSFTFMATATAPRLLGLQLRFVDIDADTWTMSVEAARAAITPVTAAIIAVHTFGTPAAVDDLEQLADDKHIALVFDAAHGLGSRRDGRALGDGGDAESFSMSPTKLVVAGEGGLICTRRHELAEKLRRLREYGNDGGYNAREAGINGRLDEMSAALALRSFRDIESNVTERHRLVEIYRKRLAVTPGITFQRTRASDRSSYKDLCVLVEPNEFGMSRDALATILRSEGVDTRRYFDPLVHEQTAFADQPTELLDVSTHVARRALSLPLWSDMSGEIAERIAELIESVHANAPQLTPTTAAVS